MANSVYKINKGINRPIEFKGLKAQYIGYLGIGLVGLLIAFVILYVIGVNMFVCLAIIAGAGVALFMNGDRMSAKYGQHGLLKKRASRNIPEFIACRSRKIFIHLKHK